MTYSASDFAADIAAEFSRLGLLKSDPVGDEVPNWEPEATAIINAVHTLKRRNDKMLAALREADKLVKIARHYFPKSIHNADRFMLENTCAAINKAVQS